MSLWKRAVLYIVRKVPQYNVHGYYADGDAFVFSKKINYQGNTNVLYSNMN